MNNDLTKSEVVTVTLEIVRTCICRLKYNKDHGGHVFKSYNRSHGTHRVNILVSLLFNIMISQGYTPTE